MSQRSIEVNVGALILVALGLLGAFVVVMGGLSFEPTLTVYVTFQNPGGLQAGAPVRISGVKVGRVSELEFRGGQVVLTFEGAPAVVRAPRWALVRAMVMLVHAAKGDARSDRGRGDAAIRVGGSDETISVHVSTHDAGPRQPLLPPQLPRAKERNQRIELVFVAPGL